MEAFKCGLPDYEFNSLAVPVEEIDDDPEFLAAQAQLAAEEAERKAKAEAEIEYDENG